MLPLNTDLLEFKIIYIWMTSHIIVALQNNGALQTHILNTNGVHYNERWLPCVVMCCYVTVIKGWLSRICILESN